LLRTMGVIGVCRVRPRFLTEARMTLRLREYSREEKAMSRLVTRLIGILLLAQISLPRTVLAEPSITVSPDPAPVGTRVSIQGTGFPKDTLLGLAIATDTTPPVVLITIPVPTDEDGNFRAGLTTPATGMFAAGKHTVTVTKQGGGDLLATASFTLTSEAASASSEPTADTRTTPSATTTDGVSRTIPSTVLAVVALVLSIAFVFLVLLALRRARSHKGRAS
jgi:hypothetical protein